MSNGPQSKSPARVISVGGGKGGVGKSIISVNLAVALAQAGRKVVLVDLDLGAANQHLLLGLSHCKPGIRALIDGSESDVAAALTPTSIPNLSLLAGTGAVLGAANITYNSKLRLLRKLRSLDATVILDVGAGVGYNALDFFLLGGQRLVVTTPQVTAIHDAYSFLKGAVLRLLHQHAERTIEAALLEPVLASAESAKVAVTLERLREQRPALADKVASLLRSFSAYLIGNQVNQSTDGGIFSSVSRMMHEFLGVDVPVMGWLQSGPVISDSVNDRKPFVLGRPSEQARVIRKIADALMAEDLVDDLELELEITDDSPLVPEATTPVSIVAAPPVEAPALAVEIAAPVVETAGPVALQPSAARAPSPLASDIRPARVGLPRVRLPTPAPVPRSLRRHPTLPGMTPYPRAR
jgi:flagellar biosynthesis protein FlhG